MAVSAAPSALSLIWLASSFFAAAHGLGVLQVHRIPDTVRMTLPQKIARDRTRQSRMLSSFDFKMGGQGGTFAAAGIYYALVNIGTPPKTYRVQVDSGSNMLWLNCAGCKQCPKKSGLGFTSTFYNEKDSKTSHRVGCDNDICSIMNKGSEADACDAVDNSCPFSVRYTDGSTSTGHLIQDDLQYVTAIAAGSAETKNESVPLVFGCGVEVAGSLTYEDFAVDGIIGFGRSNESFISQLAAEGKAKRVFAHCLDNRNGGGGIFAVGEVVSPAVNRTKMLDQYPGYRVSMKSIAVDGQVLDLPSDMFVDGEYKGAVIDSGNVLANFPKRAYDAIYKKIEKAAKPELVSPEGFPCYTKNYNVDIDAVLPNITLNFAGGPSITLTSVEYVTPTVNPDIRCLSIIPTDPTNKELKDMFMLGEAILANKIVLYDLEKKEIGFSGEHNCSTFVKIKDDHSGEIFRLNAHGLPSAADKAGMGIRALMLAMGAVLYALL